MLRLLPRTSLLLLVALGAGAAQAQAPAPDSTRAGALFVRALTEAYLGDHEQAVELLTQVLAAKPHEPAVHLALAESYDALGQPAEALFYAARAVEHGRDEPTYYATLASLQGESGRAEAAMATYEALLSLAPADRDALANLARLYERAGRHTDALDAYERLLRASGEDAAVRLRMEALYRRLGDEAAALRMLETASEAFPGERFLHLRLGVAYRESGRTEEAAAVFERVLDLDPGDDEAAVVLAELYDELGDPARAQALRDRRASGDSPEDRIRQAAHLYAAMEDDPDAAAEIRRLLEPLADDPEAPTEALFMLGDAAFAERDHAVADEVLTRALEADPRRLGAWERAAAARFYQGNLDGALVMLDEALLLFPGQVPLLRLKGYVLAKSERPEEAIRFLSEATEILAEEEPENGKDRARLLSLLGVLHDKEGDRIASDAAFEEALAIDAGNALVLNNYAYVLAERGERLRDALAMIEQADASRPGNAYFLDTLGWVLFKLGRHDEAADALLRAIAADDQFAILYEHLGDVEVARGRFDEARTAYGRALELDPDNDDVRWKLQRL